MAILAALRQFGHGGRGGLLVHRADAGVDLHRRGAHLHAELLPLLYFVQLPFDGVRVTAEVLVKWWMPVYFCAGLSFAAALSIHRVAVELATARASVRGTGRYELVEKLTSAINEV